MDDFKPELLKALLDWVCLCRALAMCRRNLYIFLWLTIDA